MYSVIWCILSPAIPNRRNSTISRHVWVVMLESWFCIKPTLQKDMTMSLLVSKCTMVTPNSSRNFTLTPWLLYRQCMLLFLYFRRSIYGCKCLCFRSFSVEWSTSPLNNLENSTLKPRPWTTLNLALDQPWNSSQILLMKLPLSVREDVLRDDPEVCVSMTAFRSTFLRLVKLKEACSPFQGVKSGLKSPFEKRQMEIFDESLAEHDSFSGYLQNDQHTVDYPKKDEEDDKCKYSCDSTPQNIVMKCQNLLAVMCRLLTLIVPVNQRRGTFILSIVSPPDLDDTSERVQISGGTPWNIFSAHTHPRKFWLYRGLSLKKYLGERGWITSKQFYYSGVREEGCGDWHWSVTPPSFCSWYKCYIRLVKQERFSVFLQENTSAKP